MPQKINFAIIGTGGMAPHHAEAIKKIKNAELIAVVSRTKRSAENFAKKYDILPYSDYDEVLKNKEIDIVDIVTPNYLHAEMGMKAALAGKHVIVEKPIATSLKEANELIKTCQDKNVKLSVISQHRFDKTIIKLKEAIDSNKLGNLVLGSISLKWHRPQQYYDSSKWKKTDKSAGGGVLIQQAIHLIDILQWLMGPVKSVFAKVDTLSHKINVEDVVVGTLKFENGALATVEAATSVHLSLPDRLEVHGDKGSVVIDGIIEGGRLIRGNIITSSFGEKIVSKIYPFGDASQKEIMAQILDVVEAIKYNQKPLIDGQEGIKTLEIILAMYYSGEIGKEVYLSSFRKANIS